MPGFVVNGNQYTSGRNVIMGKETPTSWVRAIQHIEDLGKENDNFVFKNAELREEIDELKSEIKQQEDIFFEWKQKYNALAHPETFRP